MEPKKFGFTKGLVKPRTFGLSHVPGRAAQAQALKASGAGDLDLYDFISEALLAGVAAAGYGIDHAYKAAGYLPKVGLSAMAADDMHRNGGVAKTSSKVNPLLPLSAGGGTSPVTHSYLVSRRLKKAGGNVVQGVGTVLSAKTAVDIPSTVYHGHAVALTGVHMARLEYISRKYIKAAHADANLVRDWCQLIRTMKSIKTAVRGAQMAGSVVPLASIPTRIAASVAKMGITLTTTGACYAAAAHLQLMAYREQGFDHVASPSNRPITPDGSARAPWPAIQTPTAPRRSFTPMPAIPEDREWSAATMPTRHAQSARQTRSVQTRSFTPMPTIPENAPWTTRPGAPSRSQPAAPTRSSPPPPSRPQLAGPDAGPASSIIWEIFTKRGATRLLGKYDVAALIREPAGWMAIADKLLLI